MDRETDLISQLRKSAVAISSYSPNEPSKSQVFKRYKILEAELQDLWDEMKPFDQEYVSFRKGEPASWREIKDCPSNI